LTPVPRVQRTRGPVSLRPATEIRSADQLEAELRDVRSQAELGNEKQGGALAHFERRFRGRVLRRARSILVTVGTLGVCLPVSMRQSVSTRTPASFASSR